MHLPTLNTLDALDNLLKHPAGPSVILVGSHDCPPCVLLRPKLLQLADAHPTLSFYDLDVEAFADPQLDEALTRVFKRLKLQYLPSQILISSDGSARVICMQDVHKISEQLASMV